MLVMSSSEISDITKTINQFRTVYENSGLKEMQDSFKQISESIHCSLKPIIDFSETWNKKQEEMLGSIKPALNTISELSNKIAETIHSVPTVRFPSYPGLLDAFEKYENAAPPCLYNPPNIIISAKVNYTDSHLATKDDVQELRMEIKRLNKVITTTRREKSMTQNEFSDEAEYIYSLIYKHYENGKFSNHSVMIEYNEFSDDINDNAFELGLEELQRQRYIANYESYIDGSYHIELCLRCTKALKEGKAKLISENKDVDNIVANPPYIQFLIDNGIILKDMNVVKSLNDVASSIHDNFPDIKISKQLLKQFLHNGKEYSEKKLEEAVTHAYTIDR